MANIKWGFLRETKEDAKKAGIDKDTGIIRTGLEEYLAVIFPNVHDWIHDKPFGKLSDGTSCRKRPDYKSESLKLIIEFDGVQHYTSPIQILKDQKNTLIYESEGYKVVRIPYFVQLSNDVVKKMFGINVKEKLFDAKYPSLGIHDDCSPAFLCSAGIERMAKEFTQYPKQYRVNVKYLKSLNNEYLSGAKLLEKAYEKYCKKGRK